MPGLDVKENSIRVRQRNPDDFQEGTFKTIRITDGVKAVVGKPKGKEKTEIQSLVFDKQRFKEDDVESWLKEHKSTMSMAIDMEEEKATKFSSTKLELQKMRDRIEQLSSVFESDDSDGVANLILLESLNTRLTRLEEQESETMTLVQQALDRISAVEELVAPEEKSEPSGYSVYDKIYRVIN